MVDLLDCHAIHLNEPSRTADGGVDDDIRLAGEAFLIHLLDEVVIGRIAQIDHHLTHFVEGALCLCKQCFYILPHAVGLLDDILRVHHFTFIVDRGGARDEYLTAISIIDIGTALKGDTIVAGAIQVGGGIQIMYLLLLHTCNGVVVHL